MTFKSVDKENVKIIMICLHAHNYVNKSNHRYFGIEHAGHKSKSSRSVWPYLTFGVNKHVQTLQE